MYPTPFQFPRAIEGVFGVDNLKQPSHRPHVYQPAMECLTLLNLSGDMDDVSERRWLGCKWQQKYFGYGNTLATEIVWQRRYSGKENIPTREKYSGKGNITGREKYSGKGRWIAWNIVDFWCLLYFFSMLHLSFKSNFVLMASSQLIFVNFLQYVLFVIQRLAKNVKSLSAKTNLQ